MKLTICWEQWPAASREEMRAATWNLINGQFRPTFLRGHGIRMRSRLGMKTIYQTAVQWRLLACWLEERGIGSLAVARYYLGGITGASARQVSRSADREGLVAAAAQRPGPCPMDIPVTQLRAEVPALVRAVSQLTLELQETRAELAALGNVTRLDSRRVPARYGDKQ